jgi:hypothetical protein
MRFGITIAMGFLLICVLGVLNAAAQVAPPAPYPTCQTCQLPPCGCQGHAQGCCCEGLCQQAPPNPLAPGRPSPPPCCADGYAYPNPVTWGHYATRWRRWPIEFAGPTPGVVPTPRPLGQDVPPYETPIPDEEDRRAPPHSVPRGEPVETAPRAVPPQEGAEEAPPAGPVPPQRSEETELSPESIFGVPSEEMPPSTGLPPLGAPAEEVPRTTPLAPPNGGESLPTTMPLGEPMGDQDLPPAPPFASPSLNKQPAARSASQPARPAPKSDPRTAPEDDPPPALPIALASV